MESEESKVGLDLESGCIGLLVNELGFCDMNAPKRLCNQVVLTTTSSRFRHCWNLDTRDSGETTTELWLIVDVAVKHYCAPRRTSATVKVKSGMETEALRYRRWTGRHVASC